MKHARADYNRIQDPLNLIPADEPVFLLRGQDVAAPAAIAAWIASAKQHGANADILESARYHLGIIMEYQQGFRKVPDLIVNKDVNELRSTAKSSFTQDLAALLNRHTIATDISADVLADYLIKCMKALHQVYQDRNGKSCLASEGTKYPHP